MPIDFLDTCKVRLTAGCPESLSMCDRDLNIKVIKQRRDA